MYDVAAFMRCAVLLSLGPAAGLPVLPSFLELGKPLPLLV